MIDVSRLSAGDLQAAAGISRDELIVWGRQGLLRLPPTVPAAGRGRRYGLGNLIEVVLLKQLVARGVPHLVAADFIARRRALATRSRGVTDGAPTPAELASDPRPWLVETEFDPNAEPFLDDAARETAEGRNYWWFLPHRVSVRGASSWDEFARIREHSTRWREQGAERMTPPGYGPPIDPIEAIKAAVIDAVNEGAIVVETRGPLARAFVLLFGSPSWPDRFTR